MGMHTWPLYNFLTNLVVLPSSSSDPLPGSHTYSGRVSQPCRRPTSRPQGRAAFPAVRTARPGECLALHDRPALAAPSPPPSSSRPRWSVASESVYKANGSPALPDGGGGASGGTS